MQQHDIGWWGQQWLAFFVAQLAEEPTEAQLKTAARAIARIKVEKGRLEAQVSAGQGKDEVATLRVRPWTDRDWRKLLEQLDEAGIHRLLTGQFGAELAAAAQQAGLALFPAAGTLRCSCRRGAREQICRHTLALMLAGATQLDANPYLWLEVLGRPRADLQAALQALVADQRPAEATPEMLPVAEAFWATETDPAEIPVHPGDSGAAPDALLRRLGPLPLPPETAWVEMHVLKGTTLTRAARPLDEVLREYVAYIGEAARAMTVGDLPPSYVPEPLPGKPVPLAARVLPEIDALLRQEAGLLHVDELAGRTPTAAALGPKGGRAAVIEALAQLPPEVTVLARRHVGSRTAALDARAFCHIITFDEWRRGRLSPDADWHRALTVAGAATDLPHRLWEDLRPETGDALWLIVADPAGPYLQAELRHRRTRQPATDPHGLDAARSLLRHLGDLGQWGMEEADAVAVLLAEGHYASRETQDEAWLLPFQVQGISRAADRRIFTREEHPWMPPFGRPPRRGWAELENALRWFSVDLLNSGMSRRQAELAVRTVRWWCQDGWPGAQERPGALPTLGALLEFLWVRAPRDAHRHGLAPELVPGALAAWFGTLERHYPGMAGLYDIHQLACGRGELSAHRVETLPLPDAPDAEMLGWIVEGYRWIGGERCWDAPALSNHP